MGRVEEKLNGNERVTYRTGLHWVILAAPMFLLFIAGLSIPSKGLQAVWVLVFATAWVILAAISRQNSEFVVTDNRLLTFRWFAIKRSHDIPLLDIVHADIHMPALGKLLNFGRIAIILANKSGVRFRMVNSPYELMAKLQEQALALRGGEPAAQQEKEEHVETK